MSTPPPPAKRTKTTNSNPSPPRSTAILPPPNIPAASRTTLDTIPPPPATNSRKRPASRSPPGEPRPLDLKPPRTSTGLSESSGGAASVSIPALLTEDSGKKKSRTNTPWTAAEEQRLKQMRDAGKNWSEIAKAFPNRTEGSVKKHWYKDMHYAEFAEDETKMLLDAIREYEANKWKVIGQKLGKPAKACEQFAKDHFKNL